MTRLLPLGILVVLLTSSAIATSASAHVMPWRDGDLRTKSFGQCAKGACMKRYDFNETRAHHHHRGQIVMGSVRHTYKCDQKFL